MKKLAASLEDNLPLPRILRGTRQILRRQAGRAHASSFIRGILLGLVVFYVLAEVWLYTGERRAMDLTFEDANTATQQTENEKARYRALTRIYDLSKQGIDRLVEVAEEDGEAGKLAREQLILLRKSIDD